MSDGLFLAPTPNGDVGYVRLLDQAGHTFSYEEAEELAKCHLDEPVAIATLWLPEEKVNCQ